MTTDAELIRRLLRAVLRAERPKTTPRVAAHVGLPAAHVSRLLRELARERPDWLTSAVDLSPRVNERVWFLPSAGADELERLDTEAARHDRTPQRAA
jgi:hypothetical protein